MNRNTESHFSQLPHANIQRAAFDRTHNLLTCINEGDLVPIYLDEVLPADTASIDMSMLIRMATPIYPVMDNAYIDIYYFFVPNRTIWTHWENLCGQNDQSYWAETTEYTTPQITAPEGGWQVGTIADYFGIPTGVSGLSINHLPFRAYCKIWNEWFRDENLQQPVFEGDGDATVQGTNADPSVNPYIATTGGLPLKVCKYHDYFTSCLPQPQKGEAVNLPLTGDATINAKTSITGDQSVIKWSSSSGGNSGIGAFTTGGAYYAPNSANGKIIGITPSGSTIRTQGDVAVFNKSDGKATDGGQLAIDIPTIASGLKASTTGSADLSSVSAITINELRNAIAIQQILELDARGGTRYKEQLLSHWGVVSPDARLDRSEYIGGTRIPINVNQVIQQSATDSTSPQGNVAAYSLTTASKSMCTYSATEHGWILGLAAIRVEHSYQQGLRRMWKRSTRFSYYWPMLANLGEQAVLNQEIYAQGKDADEEVFGYQEAWADYRYKPSYVTSEMRSTYAQSLDAWHYGDEYDTLPTLSSSWIKEGHENIDRTLAVSSSLSHQFIADFNFREKWVRPMPMYSIPGLTRI